LNYNNDSQSHAQTETQAQDAERQDGTQAAPERKERRSRDRYGRDRRERNASADNNLNTSAGDNPIADASVSDGQAQDEAPVSRSYFDRAASSTVSSSANPNAVSEDKQANSAVASPESTAQVTAPQTPSASKIAATSLPKVQAFELPVDSLLQVAQGSGLQWVNSDPEKIAQVQAAIAAEPKPVHVPRIRPPAVVVDEGPLVLVETRKDLSEMKLPF
jgi:ribonuclease E